VHWHDRGGSQQTSKLHHFSHLFPRRRDDAHGRGFSVNHSNGHFVRDDGRDSGGRGIAWNRYHVQSDGADAGHGLQLVQGKGAPLHGPDHAFVLAHRDESPAQAAHRRGGHGASLFDGVVQERQSRGGAVGAAAFQSHGLQDGGHAVANCRSRRQREIQHAELGAEPLRHIPSHHLAHAGDLEGGLLDAFGDITQGGILKRAHCGVYYAGAADAHVDDAVGLADAVECACHERVVIRRIGEHYQLGAADAPLLRGQIRGFLDDASH